MPSGWQIGDRVVYTGCVQLLSDGDEIHQETAGEVVGRSTARECTGAEMVKVKFDGCKMYMNMDCSLLCKDSHDSSTLPCPPDPIPLAGSYAHKLHRQGGTGCDTSSMSPGPPSPIHLTSAFLATPCQPEHKQCIPECISLEQTFLTVPYERGETVYYTGYQKSFCARGQLSFGSQGKVIYHLEPACDTWKQLVGGEDCERIAVDFEGVHGSTNVSASHLSYGPPEVPGGFAIDEEVYFTGGHEVICDGAELYFGIQGVVVGMCKAGADGSDVRVEVLFPGFLRPSAIVHTLLCRDSPQLQRGFEIGNIVFYNGPADNFQDGDELCFGMRGEIVGWASFHGDDDHSRVKVLFEGSRSHIDVHTAQISANMQPIPGGFSVGDCVYYTDSFDMLGCGEVLTFGLRGEVMSRVNVCDEKRIVVKFSGHKGVAVVLTSSVSSICPDKVTTVQSLELGLSCAGV